jgi:triosephosphate isomerase
MRKIFIAGNWKMFKTMSEAIALVEGLKEVSVEVQGVDIAVAPPFTSLYVIFQAIQSTPITLAAQNLFHETEGAYTGEVSPGMVRDAGCDYVILGHSERRQYFEETDAMVNKKVRAALAVELSPILCVGESLVERESGRTFEVVHRQLQEGLAGCSEEEMGRVVIAYEPIWAIGTGKTATVEQANEVHAHIRNLLDSFYHTEIAAKTRVLYGGSVKPSNAGELLSQPDIDGALVGGASLEAESFAGIIRAGVPG